MKLLLDVLDKYKNDHTVMTLLSITFANISLAILNYVSIDDMLFVWIFLLFVSGFFVALSWYHIHRMLSGEYGFLFAAVVWVIVSFTSVMWLRKLSVLFALLFGWTSRLH